MVREDLITSAIQFLQDPSVSESPVEKRIDFLKSKNLTKEEIDLALSRSGDSSSLAASAATSPPRNAPYYPPSQNTASYRRPPYGYGPYGDWQPPPEPPRRDWRDWFIMATVTSTATYGLYLLTKRYIAPLISPPTPPQIEQDKAAIDAEFNRAFALLDTLSADTATLKAAEEERTRRLDKTLEEVEAVVSNLKSASKRREDDNRRISDEVRGLKDDIPRAMEAAKGESDKRLKELGSELKSLKLLLGNRLGTSSQSQSNGQTPTSIPGPEKPNNDSPSNVPLSGVAPSSLAHSALTTAAQPASLSASVSRRDGPLSGFGSGSGKAAIPAWQMSAKRSGVSSPSDENETS